MRRTVTAVLAGAAWAATSGAVLAHHSFTMFDSEHPVELQGTLREFKFVSPHTSIFLSVQNPDGSTTDWNLEGANSGTLIRAGWSRQTIKPGDELIMTILPLRSGAPAGSWDEKKVKFRSGQPVVSQ
jgi:hypothetical protein